MYYRLKFDDERVTHATLDQVLEHNYGTSASFGQFDFQNPRQSSNAYMLVYIRECMLGDILDTIDHCDIPAHLCKCQDWMDVTPCTHKAVNRETIGRGEYAMAKCTKRTRVSRTAIESKRMSSSFHSSSYSIM